MLYNSGMRGPDRPTCSPQRTTQHHISCSRRATPESRSRGIHHLSTATVSGFRPPADCTGVYTQAALRTIEHSPHRALADVVNPSRAAGPHFALATLEPGAGRPRSARHRGQGGPCTRGANCAASCSTLPSISASHPHDGEGRRATHVRAGDTRPSLAVLDPRRSSSCPPGPKRARARWAARDPGSTPREELAPRRRLEDWRSSDAKDNTSHPGPVPAHALIRPCPSRSL